MVSLPCPDRATLPVKLARDSDHSRPRVTGGSRGRVLQPLRLAVFLVLFFF